MLDADESLNGVGHLHRVRDRGILTGEPAMILLWLGIEPHSSADREKLGFALQHLLADEPSLAVKSSPDGIVMLGAPGDAQLDAAVIQLVDRFGIEAAVRAIEIAYKETLTQPADGESRHIVRSAGRGEYAHVKLRIEPGEPGSGRVFENAVIGGAIPESMLPFIADGVDEVMDRGVLAGYPMDDLRVTVHDGSYHPVDSSAEAFRIAGRQAFLSAVRRAKPILLEPIMNVSVITPSEYERDVIDGLRMRRAAGFQGHREQAPHSANINISTWLPLSQTFGFGADLRRRTHSHGTFMMAFSHYAPALLSEDDGDRAAEVTVPRRPSRPPLILRASVPEPFD